MFPTKVSIILSFLILLTIFAGCGEDASTTYTGSAILSWKTPTTYSDGSQLPSANIKGYRVYFRSSSGTYNLHASYLVSAPTTSIHVKNFNLPVGQYYFVVATLDLLDRESDFSNEVSTSLK